MSGQSPPDWWQQENSKGYAPQSYPQAHTPHPSSGAPGNPDSNGPERDSRSRIGQWISTTQGILTIIASVVTIIFGGGGVAIALRHSAPAKISPGPAPKTSPPVITEPQVRAALLTSADLDMIDTNLMSADVQFPSSGSCSSVPVRPAITVTREFKDGGNLVMSEAIWLYNSPNDAHTALSDSSQAPTCAFPAGSVTNVINIASRLAGMCQEDDAWAWTVSESAIVSEYVGIVRCGRALVVLSVAAPQGTYYDNENNLVTGMEVAVPKVE